MSRKRKKFRDPVPVRCQQCGHTQQEERRWIEECHWLYCPKCPKVPGRIRRDESGQPIGLTLGMTMGRMYQVNQPPEATP